LKRNDKFLAAYLIILVSAVLVFAGSDRFYSTGVSADWFVYDPGYGDGSLTSSNSYEYVEPYPSENNLRELSSYHTFYYDSITVGSLLDPVGNGAALYAEFDFSGPVTLQADGQGWGSYHVKVHFKVMDNRDSKTYEKTYTFDGQICTSGQYHTHLENEGPDGNGWFQVDIACDGPWAIQATFTIIDCSVYVQTKSENKVSGDDAWAEVDCDIQSNGIYVTW